MYNKLIEQELEDSTGNSYIIRAEVNGKYYIINRNDTQIDTLIQAPYYVQWFDLDEQKIKKWILSDAIVIDIIPLDNNNHRHQKIINKVKDYYKDLSGDEIADSKLCDSCLRDIIRKNKSKIKQAYQDIWETNHNIGEDENKQYKKFAFDLISKGYTDKYLNTEKWKLYKNKDIFPSYEHFCFFLIHREDLNRWKQKLIFLYNRHKQKKSFNKFLEDTIKYWFWARFDKNGYYFPISQKLINKYL